MTKLLLLPTIGIPALAIAAIAAGVPSAIRDDSESSPETAFDSRADSCAAADDQASSAAQEVTPTPDSVVLNPTPEPSSAIQSQVDPEMPDLELIAVQNGWSIEEAAAHLRASDILDDIAGQVRAHRPEIYVGGALPQDPLGPPELYIKGPADEFVRSLVAGAEIEIKIIDNQPFSSEELDARQTQVTNALRALGFSNFAVGSSITNGGLIEADITRQPGLPDEPAEILAALPAEVRDGVVVTVTDSPVAVPDEAEACGDDSPGSVGEAAPRDFGPLAVIDGLGGDTALGGTGPIDIGESCVTMALPNGETLFLVWHAAEVSWDEEAREITFSRLTGRPKPPVIIRDGDTITVGGSALVTDPPVEQNRVWLATPHPSCSGEPWGVSGVEES